MNKLKLLSSSFIMALTLAAPFATYAMGPEEDHQAARPSRPFNIHTYMALGFELTAQHMNAIYHSTPQLAEYPRFLQGRLVYKPDPNRDEGKIELRIADLTNPLDGEFDLSDLSKFGNAGKYLSINTGHRKGKRPENKDKVEIWFAPHVLIEKNLAGTASHFKDIMGSWNAHIAPVGTFFTWGSWDLGWYDYATQLKWEAYNDPENNLRKIAHPSMPEHRNPRPTFANPSYLWKLDPGWCAGGHFCMSFLINQ